MALTPDLARTKAPRDRPPAGWQWDSTLYRGGAQYYERGRIPYPDDLADLITDTLDLDGAGRLLDVGCGPGIIAMTLADRFASVVGVDADRDMLARAERRASRFGVTNASWVAMRAEDLPATLGEFRVITFAQSFHWLDRARVAAAALSMLEPGGAVVVIHHWSTVGDPAPDSYLPPPPYEAISELIARYLGAERRAGQGALPDGISALSVDKAELMAAAGFEGPEAVRVPDGRVRLVTVPDLVARCFSASYCAPHLFGTRLKEFEADLIALLSTDPRLAFAERGREALVEIYRTPR